MYEYPDHIGRTLAQRREVRGLTAEQVGTALKLSPAYITAIEALDLDALPPAGYALGYVRAYAEHLGLGGAQAVTQFKAESSAAIQPVDRPFILRKREIKLPRGFAPAMTALACAAVLAFWYGSATPTQAAPTATPITPASQPRQDITPAADPYQRVILATAPSWVQVKDATGQTIVSRIMVTGERWRARSGEVLTISARDGGAIDLYVGGIRMGTFAAKGEPFTDRPLDADSLLPEPIEIEPDSPDASPDSDKE